MRVVQIDEFGEDATQIVTYTYDPLNRRVVKSLDNDEDVDIESRTFYFYDGDRAARDGAGDQIVLQLEDADADGTTESPTISHRYLYGAAVDEVLSDENAAGDVYWPLADNLGSVRDLAKYNSSTSTTSVENHITYDAFGGVVSETNSSIDHLFGYTGREFDSESGLSQYRARYYDAALGQFLSEDPLGFDAGDTNLRRFVGNHGTYGSDPSGLDEVSTPWFDGGRVYWTTEAKRFFFVEPNYDKFEIGMLDADGVTIVLKNGARVPLAKAREYANSVNTAERTAQTGHGRYAIDQQRAMIMSSLEKYDGPADASRNGVMAFVKGATWDFAKETVVGLIQIGLHPIVTAQFFMRPYPEVEADIAEGFFEEFDRKTDTAQGNGTLATEFLTMFCGPESLLDDSARLGNLRHWSRLQGLSPNEIAKVRKVIVNGIREEALAGRAIRSQSLLSSRVFNGRPGVKLGLFVFSEKFENDTRAPTNN